MGNRIDKEELVNQFKILAMSYGLKVMANDLDKAYSSLANELDEREWAKLGLRTAISMLEQVLIVNPKSKQATMAARQILSMLAAGFNLIAYEIPAAPKGSATDAMHLISAMSKEFADNIRALAESLSDGRLSDREVDKCRMENRELIKACLRIEYYLNDMGSNR